MSAETLRRAAKKIREEHFPTGIEAATGKTMLAVADWLDVTAADMAENTILDSPESGEYMPPNPEALWCDYCGGAIESADYSGDDQRCKCERWHKALVVARAYLGEAPQ